MRIHIRTNDGWVDSGKSGAIVALKGEPRVLFQTSGGTVPTEEHGIPINLNEVYEIKAGAGETLFIKATGSSDVIADVI